MELSLLIKLEFDKVLTIIDRYCSTENAKLYVQQLKPKTSLEEVVYEGKLVTEGKELLIQDNNLPIEYLPDLNETISRSSVEGSIITEKKFLQLLKLLETSRLLFNYIKNNSEIVPELYNKSKSLFVDKLLESQDRKSTRLNSSHIPLSRMPSSA